jgi:regulator of protease activity HflC (stomatin/prohibitin superfamily)
MDRLLRNPVGLAFLALAVIILLGSTFSFVPETRQGVVVRFGQPVRIINAYKPGENFGNTGAGLIVRIPFAEKIQWLDKRVQSISMDEQEVLATDQLRLQVDAFARYRITDPLKMYTTARTEERLADALPLERAASRWIVSNDPEEHVERIGYYVGLGFRHLVFHAPGPDQARFLRLYGEQVLPLLRRRFA